jgi:hypothetical protein
MNQLGWARGMYGGEQKCMPGFGEEIFQLKFQQASNWTHAKMLTYKYFTTVCRSITSFALLDILTLAVGDATSQ